MQIDSLGPILWAADSVSEIKCLKDILSAYARNNAALEELILAYGTCEDHFTESAAQQNASRRRAVRTKQHADLAAIQSALGTRKISLTRSIRQIDDQLEIVRERIKAISDDAEPVGFWKRSFKIVSQAPKQAYEYTKSSLNRLQLWMVACVINLWVTTRDVLSFLTPTYNCRRCAAGIPKATSGLKSE